MVLLLSEDLGYVSSFFKYISGTDVALDLLSRGGVFALYLWALILWMMPSFWLSIFQLSLFSSGSAGTAIIYLKGPGSIDKQSHMFALCFYWLYMNKCCKMCFILDRFETVFQGRQDTSPQECYNFYFFWENLHFVSTSHANAPFFPIFWFCATLFFEATLKHNPVFIDLLIWWQGEETMFLW